MTCESGGSFDICYVYHEVGTDHMCRSWQEQLAGKAQARLAATQAAREAAQALGEHLAALKALDVRCL